MNGEGIPVVALDIDGTMGDYHGHFLRFATDWFGSEFPDPEAINPGLPLWEHMGVDVREYRECKLAYRQGGLKRWMPPDPHASYLTGNIRAMGAHVWICTTRPYLRLDNIDPDTREWLRRNWIQYDGVIFDTLDGKNTKYVELGRQLGRRVCSIVDDLPECLTAAGKVPALAAASRYVRDRPYNRQAAGGWGRVTDCLDAWRYIKRDILEWKAQT